MNRIIVMFVVCICLVFLMSCEGDVATEVDGQSKQGSGKYAYVTNGYGLSLSVIDVSDLTRPRIVGSYDIRDVPTRVSTMPYNATAVCVAGDHAYVADGGTEGGLRVMDVSDPTEPCLVGFCGIRFATQVCVLGSYAYVAANGLHVIGVTDPGSPNEVGYCCVLDCGLPYGSVDVSGGYAYLACKTGLRVIDISDPGNPRAVGICDTFKPAREIHVSGRYAYVTAGYHGFRVVDVSDPENPSEVGYCACDAPEPPASSMRGVWVAGRYAYATDSDHVEYGLRVIDVSDPGNPHEVGSCYITGSACDVHVVEN